ncbi:hypothetical protein DSCA_54090 [Desulfosarcina alkanivorans]|uniref:Uncharacterized protein n=1 Tax=Desulfosarcina alkanivorans TaxID=571177 RepID=A0A5K7YTZ5_9BACT|nr:hypothetical protein DSCA_54090 [Desulfosarcina alkanivorans]
MPDLSLDRQMRMVLMSPLPRAYPQERIQYRCFAATTDTTILPAASCPGPLQPFSGPAAAGVKKPWP